MKIVYRGFENYAHRFELHIGFTIFDIYVTRTRQGIYSMMFDAEHKVIVGDPETVTFFARECINRFL